jgi:uncharacterized SAM-binding protein YcdF (DUF218 family)
MKTLKNFIIFFLPLLLVLAIPQTSLSTRHYWAVAFITFSALILYLANLKKFFFLKSFSKVFAHGLILTTLFIVFASHFPVGGFIIQPLRLEHSSEDADVIVVLASGATIAGDPSLSGYQRSLHGIELLKDNRAKTLLISTGHSLRRGFAEAGWVASLTEIIDAPKHRIRILKSKRITTTYTEAQYVAEELQKMNATKILLVTGGYHIFRSKKVYEKLGFEVFPAPSHTKNGIYYSTGHYLRSLDASIHEWVGLIYYRLRNFI